MGKDKEITRIVKSYLERFPTNYSRSIARAIYDSHPELGSIEGIRSVVRYYRGKRGFKNRQSLVDDRFVDQEYDIPDSDMDVRDDFILPKQYNDILMLYDVHAPYHDIRAIDAMLDWCMDHKINTIILGGDFLDFYQLSSFLRDGRKRNFADEIEVGRKLLAYIKDAINPDKIFYLLGNHEYRYERYMKRDAPELIDLPSLKLSELMGLPGVEFVEYGRLIRAGKLFIGHGDEFGGRNNNLVSPARTFSLKAQTNFMGGHFHRTSMQPMKNLAGEVMGCWSVGCLCGLYADYMRFNQWQHGFARVKINPDGTFKVANLTIYEGAVM